MVPSFYEMVLELSSIDGVTVYKSAQQHEWGIIDRGMFLFTVDERDPADEFLMYYVDKCSLG